MFRKNKGLHDKILTVNRCRNWTAPSSKRKVSAVTNKDGVAVLRRVVEDVEIIVAVVVLVIKKLLSFARDFLENCEERSAAVFVGSLSIPSVNSIANGISGFVVLRFVCDDGTGRRP